MKCELRCTVWINRSKKNSDILAVRLKKVLYIPIWHKQTTNFATKESTIICIFENILRMIQEEIWQTIADRPSRAISTSTIIFELLEPGGVVAWAHGAEVGV
jgi:hypothetical protein